MESSHQDLSHYMAEPRPAFQNNQITHYSLTFQDRPIFRHINGRLSMIPFELYG